ncbi:hypothetical protein AALP_AA7G160900 [Arabis alpina]|uniref:Tf2-1-like SH3-like domain-containing protein n=1 Tax=Arabis alpina TaxID=50452 RepID=A0A087GIE8_ARAAL|nr:hypothetical protein AALP_AA7G160900 [Arabis alpina]
MHRRRLVFEVGDLVWVVLTRDRMRTGTYNKLKAKKIGPVEVLERINDNAYRLRLPPDITTSDSFVLLFGSSRFQTPVISDFRLDNFGDTRGTDLQQWLVTLMVVLSMSEKKDSCRMLSATELTMIFRCLFLHHHVCPLVLNLQHVYY